MSARKVKVEIKDPRFGLSRKIWDSLGDQRKKKKLYNIFKITQANGKERQIEAPCEELKEAQRKILDTLIYPCAAPSHVAHGFVKSRSPYTAAKNHVDKDIIIRIDIKDFFPSINEEMLRDGVRRWSHRPMSEEEMIDAIIRVCTIDGRLPQGAPTSPALSNIVCRAMDYHMLVAGEHLMAYYTRYADDLVFSARYECISSRLDKDTGLPAWKCEHYHRKLLRPDERGMCRGCRMAGPSLNQDIPWLVAEIEKFGFQVNQEKTRIQRRGKRQKANGLVVNYEAVDPEIIAPRVNDDYRRETRAMAKDMLLVEAFGDNDINTAKGRRSRLTGDLLTLKGRISHIHSANPKHAEPLSKMAEQIEILQGKNNARRRDLVKELSERHAA